MSKYYGRQINFSDMCDCDGSRYGEKYWAPSSMLWAFASLPFARLVALMRLSAPPARSLIRAWHELHLQKLVTHDFTQLLAPTSETRVYHAAIRHDEIRAIGVERKLNGTSELLGVAYAPNDDECASALVAELATSLLPENNLPCRWKYESVFVREDAVPSLYEQEKDSDQENTSEPRM